MLEVREQIAAALHSGLKLNKSKVNQFEVLDRF